MSNPAVPTPPHVPISYLVEESPLPKTLGLVVITPTQSGTYYLPKLDEHYMPGTSLIIKNRSPFLLYIKASEGDFIDGTTAYLLTEEMVITLVVGAPGTNTWLITSRVSAGDRTVTLFTVFDILDQDQTPLNQPFAVGLNIVTSGITTQLGLPSLCLKLPLEGGTLITVANLIPEQYRPFYSVYPAFSILGDQGTQDCDLFIGRDGTIRIEGEENFPISGGMQNFHPSTANYLSQARHVTPPVNIPLGVGTSRVNQPDNPDLANQFRDWYRVAFTGGYLCWCFPDNSATKDTPPYSLNVMTQSGRLVDNVLTLESPVMAMEVPLGVYCAENSVTINPLDPTKRFFTTTLTDRREGLSVQAWCGVSQDSGQTWVTRQLDVPPLSHFDEDWSATYDSYGNLWLITLISSGPDQLPVNLAIYRSEDNGLSFQLAYQTTDANELISYDFPQMKFGGDGEGGMALWFSVNKGDRDSLIPFYPCLGYIPFSDGVPNPGDARLVELTNYDFTLNGGIKSMSLAVTDYGKVFMYGFSGVNYGGLFTQSRMLVNPVGISFTQEDIIGPILVSQNNDSQLIRPLNFQNVCGFTQPTNSAVVFNEEFNSILTFNTNFSPPFSQDMTLSMDFSDNDGSSWIYNVPISDTGKGNRALFTAQRDRSTGNVGLFWLDAREDPNNNEVRPYVAVIIAEALGAELIGPEPIIVPGPPHGPVNQASTASKVNKVNQLIKATQSKLKEAAGKQNNEATAAKSDKQSTDKQRADKQGKEATAAKPDKQGKEATAAKPVKPAKSLALTPRQIELLRKGMVKKREPRTKVRSNLRFTSRVMDVPRREINLKPARQMIPVHLPTTHMSQETHPVQETHASIRPMVKPRTRAKAHPFLPD